MKEASKSIWLDMENQVDKDLINLFKSEIERSEKMNISGNTKLIGLLGDPISHSLSPFMHNLSFNKVKRIMHICVYQQVRKT